jgi:hypothetical protein
MCWPRAAELIQACWQSVPTLRPKMSEVLQRLQTEPTELLLVESTATV